jgi:DNA-binding LacI/PurR family transcriptional regulator
MGKASLSPDAYTSILNSLANRVVQSVVNGYVRELLQAVDKKSRATAWICSGDGTALKALQYLSDSARNVPADIAVASFDNSMQAYEQKLTSVDFNMDAAAYLMLRFVSNPDDRIFDRTRTAVEIEPTVIVRNSTEQVRSTGA